MKAIINKITEYNNKSMRNVKNTRKEIDNDIKIEVVSTWTIKGEPGLLKAMQKNIERF